MRLSRFAVMSVKPHFGKAEKKSDARKEDAMAKTHLQPRDTKDGQFLTKKEAETLPPERVVWERVPNPGYGDTDRGKKK